MEREVLPVWGRRRRYRRARGEWLRGSAAAFGVGLLLALVCSVRLALLIAALLLIYIGITTRSC